MTGHNGPPDAQHSSDTTSDEYTFRCPHCGETYPKEQHVGVHITRADDSTHAEENGFVPEAEIQVINEDGVVVDTIAGDEIDGLETLDINDFPEDLSDERRHVLVAASKHPQENTRRKLFQMVQDRLASDEYDTDSISERTVGRALDGFYHPDSTTDTEAADNGSESLAELANTQQAIVIARLACPDTAKTGLADVIGCSNTYSSRITQQKSELIAALKQRLEAEESLEEVIVDELDADDFEALYDEGLLTDIPIDIAEIAAGLDVDLDESTTTPTEETDADSESDDPDAAASADSQWGSPLADHGVMQAAPDDHFTAAPSTSKNEAEEDGTQATLPDSETPLADDAPAADNDAEVASTDGGSATETTINTPDGVDPLPDGDQSNNNGQPANEAASDNTAADVSNQPEITPSAAEQDVIAQIEALQENVAFLKETVNPIAQPDGPTALLQSFAERVEERCEAIRQAHTDT
jgi:hypothetical protein